MTHRLKKIACLLLLISLLTTAPPAAVRAVSPPPPMQVSHSLAISQIKITGDEFIVIQNNSSAGITDLSQYWLEVFNNVNPLAAGANNSSQQLPAVPLAVGQTLLLSASPRVTCGATIAGKLNLSLTDSSGFLEVVQFSQGTSGNLEQRVSDLVSWSSSGSGLIQSVPSSTKLPQAVYYRYASSNDAYNWQLAELSQPDNCQLKVTSGTGSAATTQAISAINTAASNDDVPATIISLGSAGAADQPADSAQIPASDNGLTAPQISELLPNPIGSGTDASDEFIELYNSNDAVFSLSGFRLQVGTTSVHTYTFPAGSQLAAKSFVAFFAGDTGLSLSNSGGQVKLYDPLGAEIGASTTYTTAKDGQSWAVANGQWYWSVTPTPASANVITQPPASKTTSTLKTKSVTKTSTKTSSATKTTKVAKTKIPKAPKAAKKPKTANASYSSASAEAAALKVRPIHTWTIALVAAAAVLYGAYEYRLDLANKYHQFRRYFGGSRPPRQ